MPPRRAILNTVVALLAIVLPVLAVHADDLPAAAPNIVLILADDLGTGDLGCYNPESRIPTPHLDRLAREGLRLTDAHSPSAVCTPTRYGILVGRYAWRTRLTRGVLIGDSPPLIEPDRPTVASCLRARGYRTACIGKWHLGWHWPRTAPDADGNTAIDWTRPITGGPTAVGFDHFFGISASLDMPPYCFVEDDRATSPATERVAASAHRRREGGGYWRGGAVAGDFRHVDVLPTLAKRAEAFVADAAANDQPFFLYMPLTAPHTPWVPSPAFEGKSDAGHYGDFVAQVDAVVGRVLAALATAGVDRGTVVVFSSDNGAHWPRADVERWGHAANLHYRGQKADIHEGGHRVPMIVRWPGTTPVGTTSDALVGQVDLFATLASIADADVPDGAAPDSVDLVGLLRDPTRPGRDELVHHAFDGMFAIRAGRWKLIEGLGSGGFTRPKRVEPEAGGPRGQLYDLEADPGETHNLWLERPEEVKRLSERLDAIRDGRA